MSLCFQKEWIRIRIKGTWNMKVTTKTNSCIKKKWAPKWTYKWALIHSISWDIWTLTSLSHLRSSFWKIYYSKTLVWRMKKFWVMITTNKKLFTVMQSNNLFVILGLFLLCGFFCLVCNVSTLTPSPKSYSLSMKDILKIWINRCKN